MTEQEKPTTEVLDGDDALMKFLSQEDTTQKVDEDFSDILQTQEQQVATPPAQVAEQEAPAEERTEISNIYTQKLQEYIEEGFFMDGDIELEDEQGNVQKVALSSLTDVTPEMFEAIKAEQKKLKDEEIKSKYVSVEGLDETTKKIIELKKAGGDITAILQTEAQYVNPLKDLDLGNEQHQEYLVRNALASQGMKPKHVDLEIQELRENMTLDIEAEKVAKLVQKNYDDYVEKEKANFLQQKEEEKKVQKEFRKTFSETIKEMGLTNETVHKNLLDNAAKFDEHGVTTVDSLYFEAKKDPKLYAKLALLLTDEKAFNDFVGVKIKNEVKVDTIKSLFKITPKTISAQKEKVKTEQTGDALQEFLQQNK